MPAIVTWVTIAGAQSPHLYRGVGNPRDIARDRDGCHNRRGTIAVGQHGYKYLIYGISSFRETLVAGIYGNEWSIERSRAVILKDLETGIVGV
ncbi:hypothetical protein L6452_11491 [Arctium lappa]|uniref:Uncharacterized protein n=1 Tax=Arctium lappa TaxID=4217 RepID=A0ACB9DPM1_ARCLA|nr:hypothetical protein L6452_11491 [Arctium lappa]